MKEHHIPRQKPLLIHYFYHGVDFALSKATARDQIRAFVQRRYTFLMVGSIVPRKNHLLALQALNRLLTQSQGNDVQILILGRDGWNSQPFKDMYVQESTLNGHVLWIQDADDEELQWAYQNANALLYPSMMEGFGLPIIEAAHFELPILCSDIPVFREIAGNGATYFKVNDVDALATTMLEFLRGTPHPNSATIPVLTWKECASRILDVMEGKNKPYAIIE